jgi:transcription termination/antitermination protein NusG
MVRLLYSLYIFIRYGAQDRQLRPSHHGSIYGANLMKAAQENRWYALRTRSRFEKVVHAQLAHRGIEPFLPLIRRQSQWKDRKKIVDWPLFPGYCFAKFAPEQQRAVLQAPGVIQVIGSALVAEAIPETEIASLQRVMQHHVNYEQWPYEFNEDTMVTVIRGPLQGLQGRFVRRKGEGQLVLAVHLIQQAAAVTIALEDVAPITPLSRPAAHQHVPQLWA